MYRGLVGLLALGWGSVGVAQEPGSLPASVLQTAPASAPASLPVSSPAQVSSSAVFAGLGLKAVAELGFLGVLSHQIQFSQTGTLFDYRAEGGQDVLFRFERFSLEARPDEKNELVFLYQPIELVTRVPLEREMIQDNIVFPENTPIEARYSFPFWRTSYLRHLSREGKNELALGGSLQIRNATIGFRSLDGELLQTNRDVGPVPLFKVRAKRYVGDGVWLAGEADGIYAPIKYLNGDDVDVVGALLDASGRLGFDLPKGAQAFINLRYLGGGAEGTGDPQGTGDGFVRNWLNFFSLSAGLTYDLKTQN